MRTVEEIIERLDLDPAQVSESDRVLLEKALSATSNDEAGSGEEPEIEGERPQSIVEVLAGIGKNFMTAVLEKGNRYKRMGELFRALSDEDEEDQEALEEEDEEEEAAEAEDEESEGEPTDEELESEVASVLGEAAESEEDEDEEDDLARFKRTRKSLTDAVEDVAGEDVEFIDPDQLVAALSKSLGEVVEGQLKPLHDEVKDLREANAALQKSIDALEQEPAVGHPYATMAKQFAGDEQTGPSRAEVIQVTQDAAIRSLNGFTPQEAVSMQKAVGTENWAQYATTFRQLVEDLRDLDK